ncbi:MAG TPA: hypothetical protein VJM12_03235 [Pyrinomonadaceae bacterium]|nr:hypothetical protein [Pyrinomonadaceae bacterium]
MKFYRIAFVFCLLLCGHVALAQEKKEPVQADWLAKDVAHIERFLPQLQREPLTLAKLETIFGERHFDYTDLGFGGRTFTFSKPGGYTSLRVNGFAFNDTIGRYEISLDCSSWAKISSVLIEAWKRSSDLEFKEWKEGIYYEREFPDVIAEFKKTIGAQLGELQPVTVPRHLKDTYEELVALGRNSRIGSGPCGYGGVTPIGKTAIDTLVAANRLDLIGNILKGYNPGGRMYAALALIAMQRKGIELPPDLRQALEVVRTMDIRLETCSGCIVSSKTPKLIIAEWPF